ncbi:MAG: hypothetical protein P8O16_18585 [Algoriphagus sp.]|jgi:hypothetical protein|uniref:hypothetical protein n=1 Tax=Algoriphagus sp. TaxID=1872435 RepID=UPI0026358125|nr:hypothetical protein [Algoriphagus sp.]MDG1279293.1 hypothetical protein [Algoriphagus sp.]
MKIRCLILILIILDSCAANSELYLSGKHYQKKHDYQSLKKVLDLMPKYIETKQVKRILGRPIDNGFDYRYLSDSISSNQCPVGLVFNINNDGKITHRWLDEICE